MIYLRLMITKEILCVELSIHNKIHLYPKNNWQRISQEIILFTPSKIIFWPSLPDFGSIGRVEIVFSMYSYRLATFLSYNQLSKAILILSRVVGRVGGWVGGWVVGWAYLPFDTLDHVRTIFFKFLVFQGVWHRGETILKSV